MGIKAETRWADFAAAAVWVLGEDMAPFGSTATDLLG